MGELGTCARCGADYPWPLGQACVKARSPRSRFATTTYSEFAAWLAREHETRAALGSTPLVKSELVDFIVAYAELPQRERMERPKAKRSVRGRWATPAELEMGRSSLMRPRARRVDG